jgi:outer membrane protein TolC
MHSRPALGALMAGLVAGSLAACAVGPNFKRPTPPTAPGYGSAPVQGQTAAAAVAAAADGAGGAAQTFVAGMDIPSQWWTLFKSPALDQLVEQALKGNPDVDAAKAALRQAHELYAAQRTSFFPLVQGEFSGLRAKNALGTLANPTSLPQVNP